jgi:FkbM family methyltransferase
MNYNNVNLSNPKKDEEFLFDNKNFYSSQFNTKWFSELNITPKVIFDIGSYDFGDSIRYKNEFKDCDVFGFEADVDRYQKTFIYAESCGVKTFNNVVYSESNIIDFYPAKCLIKDAGSFHSPGENGGQGSIYLHNQNYKKTFSHIEQESKPIKIQSTSVVDFCKKEKIKEITLIQIDAEGAEFEIIKGFGDLRPKLVFVEIQNNLFENNINSLETHNLLYSMGYILLRDLNVDKLYIYNN